MICFFKNQIKETYFEKNKKNLLTGFPIRIPEKILPLQETDL